MYAFSSHNETLPLFYIWKWLLAVTEHNDEPEIPILHTVVFKRWMTLKLRWPAYYLVSVNKKAALCIGAELSSALCTDLPADGTGATLGDLTAEEFSGTWFARSKILATFTRVCVCVFAGKRRLSGLFKSKVKSHTCDGRETECE